MKAMVTGAAGFIGRAIAIELIEAGWDVITIDPCVRKSPRSFIKNYTMTIQDFESGNYKIGRQNFIFHFGSPSSDILFRKDKNTNMLETLSGFLSAVNLAQRSGAYLVVPSTSSLYSDNLNDYAKTKALLEAIADSLGVDILMPRIFAGYGAGEGHKGDYASVIYQFCKAAVNDGKIGVFGDGSQSRDFIYIDDIVDQVISLAMTHRNVKGLTTVVIGTGVATTFKEVVNTISRLLPGKTLKIEYVKKPVNYLEKTKCDNAITPNIDIEHGIKKVLSKLLLKA